MHSITDVNVFCVSLLKESASLGGTFTKSSGFPAVESSRGLDLEDLGTVLLIVATDNHTDAERTNTT